MEIVIVWFVLALLVGVYANSKGRSGFLYFLLALLLSPLLGFLIVLVAGPDERAVAGRAVQTGSRRKCPFCAELILPEARVCKHCGRDLPGYEAPSVDPATGQLPESARVTHHADVDPVTGERRS